MKKILLVISLILLAGVVGAQTSSSFRAVVVGLNDTQTGRLVRLMNPTNEFAGAGTSLTGVTAVAGVVGFTIGGGLAVTNGATVTLYTTNATPVDTEMISKSYLDDQIALLSANVFYGATNEHPALSGWLIFSNSPPSDWTQTYNLLLVTNVGSRLTVDSYTFIPAGTYGHEVFMSEVGGGDTPYYSTLVAVSTNGVTTNVLGQASTVNVDGALVDSYISYTHVLTNWNFSMPVYIGVQRYATRGSGSLTIYGGTTYPTQLRTPSLEPSGGSASTNGLASIVYVSGGYAPTNHDLQAHGNFNTNGGQNGNAVIFTNGSYALAPMAATGGGGAPLGWGEWSNSFSFVSSYTTNWNWGFTNQAIISLLRIEPVQTNLVNMIGSYRIWGDNARKGSLLRWYTPFRFQVSTLIGAITNGQTNLYVSDASAFGTYDTIKICNYFNNTSEYAYISDRNGTNFILLNPLVGAYPASLAYVGRVFQAAPGGYVDALGSNLFYSTLTFTGNVNYAGQVWLQYIK